MSAATTPSQLFLQAAGMSSGWAQNAQGMQFARERAGVADRNAAADDAFRLQQWEAQQKAFRDRLAQEDAQRRANATITKLLLAPQDQPIVPQGPGIENGIMPEVDFRTMVDDESLQHASPGLASLLTSTSFDRQKAQREWNQTAAHLDELMRGNRSQMAPEIVKKALALGMHVPFEKMPRGMRESLQHEDAGLKQMMLGEMGIAEGSPEYERFMAGDRVGSGLNERHSRWQKQKAIDDAKRGALAESGIMPTVADPATGQEVPNPQHAAMMKLPAAELEGTLKRMMAEKKAADEAAAQKAARAAFIASGMDPAEVDARFAGDAAGVTYARERGGTPPDVAEPLRKRIADLDRQIEPLAKSLAGKIDPMTGEPSAEVTGDGWFNVQSGADKALMPRIQQLRALMQEKAATEQQLNAATAGQPGVVGGAAALTGQINPQQMMAAFQQKHGRMPTREEWAAMRPPSMQGQPR